MSKRFNEIDMSPVSPEELGGFVGPQMATPASEIQPGMPLQLLSMDWVIRRLQYPDALPIVKKFLGIKEEPNNKKGE